MVTETTGKEYPSPAVPISPILSFGSFGFARRSALPSILEAGQAAMFTSGRMAIAAAIKHMGLGQGDKVLVPAFHCTSMIDPLLWASVEPVFYKLNNDLSVDLADIQSKCDERTRCLMVTHYFGFYQDIVRIRKFCDDGGLLLLEDCAHAYFGECAGRPVGFFGDYAIASTIKFFPIYDGGCLVSSSRDLSEIKQHRPGAGFQARAILNPLEKAVSHDRFQPFNYLMRLLFGALNGMRRKIKRQRTCNTPNEIPDAVNGGYGFDPRWVDVDMSWPSRKLMNILSTERVVERRRKNYVRMAEAFRDVPGCKVLFPVLDQSVVPYVFPLLIENQQVFHELKMRRVPIYRWEDLRDDGCDVSLKYSRQLLQFPCHQELRSSELDWIINKVRDVLKGGAADQSRS